MIDGALILLDTLNLDRHLEVESGAYGYCRLKGLGEIEDVISNE